MSFFLDNYPKHLTIKNKFKQQLLSIPENQEMPTFEKIDPPSWASIVKSSKIRPWSRINFKPKIANWFQEEIPNVLSFHDTQCNCQVYNFPHNEEFHYQENTSFFPDVNGNLVRFNLEADLQPIHNIDMCSHCNSIQDDNILLRCCYNQHYLCSECFTKEKTKSTRHNVEYEREQRNNSKQQKIKPYEYICSACNTFNRLNFNIYYGDDMNEDIVIIDAYKN